MGNIVKTAKCRFCGQMTQIEADEELTAAQAEEQATMTCNCTDAVEYQKEKQRKEKAMAASIASVIMFACDELHFATGAQAMIHKPLCMAYGNADDFKAVIKQLNLCEDSILDVYMEHVQEGVTRDKIQSLMSNETWFDSKKMQQYFNVEIEEKAAVAACASDYFEKYNNIPEALKGTEKENIVDAVLAELEKRNSAATQAEEQRIEAEKREILDDLYLYGM